MNTKMAKTLGILAIAGYTALVGGLGVKTGREIERAAHRDDGIVLTATGSALSNPRINLRARFGDREVAMKDLDKYARELAPYFSFGSSYSDEQKAEGFAGVMRYILLNRDNNPDTYPGQFRVVPQEIGDEETSVKVMPGEDTDFEYSLY